MGETNDGERRRAFLAWATRVGMASGLIAGYGGLAALMTRYLYSSTERATRRVFVAAIVDFPEGSSRSFVGPAGERVSIARHAGTGTIDDFVALSSTCPHLGCQVHWQGDEHRFFCPCHDGAFDADGKAIAGPPARAGQSLPRYPLHLEEGLLFIELPV